MRLEQKQFVPFMIGVAVITMLVIVFSSFNFERKQRTRFNENIATSDSLKTMPLRVLNSSDSTSIAEQQGNSTLLVFWASWSEKSTSMLDEIQKYTLENDSLIVLAGLVKDAEESLPEVPEYPGFTYLDGTHLFNHLKVPGFPSYILFDAESNIVTSQIGYEKGVGYDSLKVYIDE
ncbi:TlpA family protein disulfide reductase [Gracilimonas sp. BCB1]|uniref:TlpA family protein disulfide reductase n=1 Tax=Gracilimonas sp. BCB1 TaxID=3152362 RepID=UPI0032D954FC